MKVIIAGGTGMVGSLILKHCLSSNQISQVVSFVRKPTKNSHPKIKEVVVADFENYSGHLSSFENVSAAFFCIGVYTGQFPDDVFKKITVNYAVEFAKAVAHRSSNAKFCLLSGQGADRTEKSKTSFAKYKGMAENRIAKLPLNFYTFRPGYIYPSEKRNEPNLVYRIMRFCYPLLKLFGENMTVTSEELASAMYRVGIQGRDKEILENRDILTEVLH